MRASATQMSHAASPALRRTPPAPRRGPARAARSRGPAPARRPGLISETTRRLADASRGAHPNAAVGPGASSSGGDADPADPAPRGLSDRGRRTLARALGNVDSASAPSGVHFSSHPLDAAGKNHDAAPVSAPPLLRARHRSNVVPRAKREPPLPSPEDKDAEEKDEDAEAEADAASASASASPPLPEDDDDYEDDDAEKAEKEETGRGKDASPAAAAETLKSRKDTSRGNRRKDTSRRGSTSTSTRSGSTPTTLASSIANRAEVACLVAAGGSKVAELAGRRLGGSGSSGSSAGSVASSGAGVKFVIGAQPPQPPGAALLARYAHSGVADWFFFGATAASCVVRRLHEGGRLGNNVVAAPGVGVGGKARRLRADAPASAPVPIPGESMSDVIARVRARADSLASAKAEVAASKDEAAKARAVAAAAAGGKTIPDPETALEAEALQAMVAREKAALEKAEAAARAEAAAAAAAEAVERSNAIERSNASSDPATSASSAPHDRDAEFAARVAAAEAAAEAARDRAAQAEERTLRSEARFTEEASRTADQIAYLAALAERRKEEEEWKTETEVTYTTRERRNTTRRGAPGEGPGGDPRAAAAAAAAAASGPPPGERQRLIPPPGAGASSMRGVADGFATRETREVDHELLALREEVARLRNAAREADADADEECRFEEGYDGPFGDDCR